MQSAWLSCHFFSEMTVLFFNIAWTVFTVMLEVSSLKALSLISSISTLLTSQNLSSFHRWMFLGNIRANSFFLSKYHTRNPSLRSCFLPSFLFLLLSILSFHFVVRFYFFFAPDLSLFLEEIWVHSECCTREHCYEHPRTEHAMCSSDVLFFCLPWYLPTYLWRRMVTFKVQIHF